MVHSAHASRDRRGHAVEHGRDCTPAAPGVTGHLRRDRGPRPRHLRRDRHRPPRRACRLAEDLRGTPGEAPARDTGPRPLARGRGRDLVARRRTGGEPGEPAQGGPFRRPSAGRSGGPHGTAGQGRVRPRAARPGPGPPSGSLRPRCRAAVTERRRDRRRGSRRRRRRLRRRASDRPDPFPRAARAPAGRRLRGLARRASRPSPAPVANRGDPCGPPRPRSPDGGPGTRDRRPAPGSRPDRRGRAPPGDRAPRRRGSSPRRPPADRDLSAGASRAAGRGARARDGRDVPDRRASRVADARPGNLDATPGGPPRRARAHRGALRSGGRRESRLARHAGLDRDRQDAPSPRGGRLCPCGRLAGPGVAGRRIGRRLRVRAAAPPPRGCADHRRGWDLARAGSKRNRGDRAGARAGSEDRSSRTGGPSSMRSCWRSNAWLGSGRSRSPSTISSGSTRRRSSCSSAWRPSRRPARSSSRERSGTTSRPRSRCGAFSTGFDPRQGSTSQSDPWRSSTSRP